MGLLDPDGDLWARLFPFVPDYPDAGAALPGSGTGAYSPPMVLAAGNYLPRGQLPRSARPSTGEPAPLEDFPVGVGGLLCAVDYKKCQPRDLYRYPVRKCTPPNGKPYIINRDDPIGVWRDPDTQCERYGPTWEFNPDFHTSLPGLG
jgi:hypothetical protein